MKTSAASSKSITRIASLSMGIVAIVMTSGCYERVVSAHGIGSSDAQVQPSYRSNTAADRVFDRVVSEERTTSARSQRFVDPGSRAPGDR